MRTASGGEQTLLAGRVSAQHLKVEIKDDGGSWIDYSDYLNLDWQDRCEITADVNARVAQATLLIARETEAGSASPLMNTEIAAGRAIRIGGSRVAVGGSPSYKPLFQGVIDSIDWKANPMLLVARDDAGKLVDRWVREVTTYGSEAGTPIEAVMQSLIDDWASGAFTLYTPSSPGFMITPYSQAKQSVFDALQALADLIGWVIEYRWDNGTGAFRLTFYSPDRDPSATDWTFGPDDYYDVSRCAENSADVRNLITVRFTDRETEARDFVELEDPASVAKYDLQWAEFDEADDSPINSRAQAEALAEVALADLAWPVAEQEIETDLFWPIQLNDFYLFEANGVHYGADQQFGVTGYRHVFEEGKATTWIQTRGKPVGHTEGWLKREKRERPVNEQLKALEILNFREIRRTETDVTYGWKLGTDLHAAWIYNYTETQPLSEDKWPSAEAPRPIADHITDREGEYTVAIPEAGRVAYLQVEGRKADGSFGDMERALVFPLDVAGDYIAFASCTVNQSDGSVKVAGWTTDRAHSLAHAFNTGLAGATPAPTEAMAEAQGAGADGGGLVTGFTSDFEVSLPPGTVAPGEVIKILLIAYINADGTGPDGTALDHDTPVGCAGERFKIVVSDQVADGILTSNKLTDSSKNYGSTVDFAAVDWNTVEWFAGSLVLADGTTYAIAAGNTGNIPDDNPRYVYFDASVSTTVLQVTSSLATATTGEGRVFICFIRRAPDTAQSPHLVPSVGEIGLNGSNLGPESIQATHLQADIIQAHNITADAVRASHIRANELSAIHIDTLDLTTLDARVSGTLHAAVVIASEQFTAPNAVFENAMEIQAGEGAPRVVIDQASGGGAVTLRDPSGNVAGSVVGLGSRTLSIGGVDALLLGDSEDIAIGGSGASIGFFGTGPTSKPVVSGSRGGNAALASLLTALANLGLITDSSS